MKRGRKSAEELAILDPANLIAGAYARPVAPHELSDAEAEVWTMTIARMPANYFTPETWPTLKAMCRHVVMADKLTEIIRKNEGVWSADDFVKLGRLTAMRDRECRSALACGRSLRLTKQAQIEPRTAARAANRATGPRPWEEQ
jgi:hypothetical protein